MKLLLPILILIMLYPSNISSQALPGDGNEIEDTNLFEFLHGKGGGGLNEFLENVLEVEIEDPNRKASTDKFMGDWSSLPDMELYYTPHFDISPWNFDLPDLPPIPYTYGSWPEREPYRFPDDPGTGWYIYGCWLDCPEVADCNDEEFICTISTSQAISSIGFTGSGGAHREIGSPNEVVVWMHPDQPDFSRIEVCVTTAPLPGQEKSGTCCDDVLIRCGCECIGAQITIVPNPILEDPAFGDLCYGENTSATFNLDFDSRLACPPFYWDLDAASDGGEKTGGDDFLLNGTLFGTAETSSWDQTVTVSSSGACGGAVLTVTDQCGVSDTYHIQCSDLGNWVIDICSGPGCCYLPGAATSTTSNQFIRVEGDIRQLQGFARPVASGAVCTGSVCNDPHFPCTLYQACGAQNYGCDDCLSASVWNSGGACSTPAVVYDMCGCAQCWNDAAARYDCACHCTMYFQVDEWKCP